MEQNKICPNCERPVKSGSTYCRNCGYTLGIKCPKCASFLPAGTIKCPNCAAVIVKKDNPFTDILNNLRKNYRTICAVLQIILLITVLASLFLSFIKFSYSSPEQTSEIINIKAYQTISYLFGGTSPSIDAVTGAAQSNDPALLAAFILNLSGLCYLVIAVTSLICFLLLVININRIYKKTAGRLIAGNSVIFVCSVLTFVFYKLAVGKIIVPLTLSSEDITYKSATWSFAIMTVSFLSLFFIIAVKAIILKNVKVKNPAPELSLADITVKPFAVLISKIHLPESKKEKSSNPKEYSSFEFTPSFSKYIILLVASLIFTQALRNTASHIFFVFVLILPVFLFLYTLTAKLAIYSSILSESKTTEKYLPCNYEFALGNSSVLAYPFIDAVVSLPLSNSVRCEDSTVKISLSPLSKINIKNNVSFKYRGTYEIGIKYIYVYDFLKIMRIRINISCMNTFYVMPRRLNFENPDTSAISDSSKTIKSNITYDKLEISDIREYRAGDSLKSIHWKLSSKSDDFVVKDFNTGTSNTTYIYCDLSTHFENNVQNETEAHKKTKNKKRKNNLSSDYNKTDENADKTKKIKSDDFVHEISDKELAQKLEQHRKRAEHLNKKNNKNNKSNPAVNVTQDTASAFQSFELTADLKAIELSTPEYYEDINEFLADGTVELAVAAVIRELRKGRNAVLSWFDNRSESGIYSYALSGENSFESIYKLFATAPLCDSSLSAEKLCLMVEDIPGASKIFIVPSIDNRSITGFCNLHGNLSSDTFEATEVIFYNPDERFINSQDRRLYIESCRRQLSENGIILTEGYLPSVIPENHGGVV